MALGPLLSAEAQGMAGLRQQSLGRLLSTRVPQSSCCQTFPADQEEQMSKALGEETVNYFLPLGQGPPSMQQNEFISSWRRQDSFHKVVKPKEKHIHTKTGTYSQPVSGSASSPTTSTSRRSREPLAMAGSSRRFRRQLTQRKEIQTCARCAKELIPL